MKLKFHMRRDQTPRLQQPMICSYCNIERESKTNKNTKQKKKSRYIYIYIFKRQPIWFNNLNSMVPVKGIVLFKFRFFESSIFLFVLLL